jgi:hypothetical protein
METNQGSNKVIPIRYKTSILTALASYPELKNVRINFRLVNRHPVPYGTTLSLASLFKSHEKRTYYITLLEEAEEPEYSALFRNLSEEKRVAVIAHELVHVLQFSKCSPFQLLQIAIMYQFPFFKKKMERDADLGAIKHGFGKGLYDHAVYLRRIPGYIKKRPDINKCYLKPEEIMKYLNN